MLLRNLQMKRRDQGGRKPGVKDRANPLHKGSFAECCRALTEHITPPNQETI